MFHCFTLIPPEAIEIPPPGGGPPSRQWVLVGVADKSQLGSPDRLREKMDKLQQRATKMATWAEGRMRLAKTLGQASEIVAQATDSRTQEADRRIQEAEKKVEAMKRALHESQTERELRVETEKSLQEANMRAHLLESQGAESGQLKQRLDTTEKQLHSREIEMRKQQRQMEEMKELEVISLQYNLREREEQVQRQQEEMRMQQNHFQSEKQVLTSQIKFLEDSLQARKRGLQESQAREIVAREETEKSLQEANTRVQESERGMQEATRQKEEAERITGRVRARAESAEIQADKVPALEQTIRIKYDKIRRQTRQIDNLAHQLESHEQEISKQKQQLQSTEIEMRKQQHQMEMKELEDEGREEQIQKQQEMRLQFQSEKQALTSQIKSLEDILVAKKGETREVSSQTSEVPHLAGLQHPDTTQVEVAEVQQRVEAVDLTPELESLGSCRAEQEAKLLQQSQEIAIYEQRLETKELEVISLQSGSQTSEVLHLAGLQHPDTTKVKVAEVQQRVEAVDLTPELESLRRSRAEREAKLLQQSQDIAIYEQRLETKELEVISLHSHVKEREEELQQQRDERRKQEEQLQQELQNREKSLEERVTKAEYLESVHTQQFDELIQAQPELIIEKDEEIRQLRSQQAQTTGKGEPDSLGIGCSDVLSNVLGVFQWEGRVGMD